MCRSCYYELSTIIRSCIYELSKNTSEHDQYQKYPKTRGDSLARELGPRLLHALEGARGVRVARVLVRVDARARAQVARARWLAEEREHLRNSSEKRFVTPFLCALSSS